MHLEIRFVGDINDIEDWYLSVLTFCNESWENVETFFRLFGLEVQLTSTLQQVRF